MTPIDLWAPKAGTLTEFRPTEQSLAAASGAPRSDQPLSFLQEGHIRTADHKRSQGVDWSPWIGFTFTLPGDLDREALRRAVQAFVLRHNTLHSWFEVRPSEDPAGSGVIDRRVVDASTIELTPHSVGPLNTTDAVREHVSRSFAGDTSPLQWPSFISGAVEHGTGAGFTIYYGVDHSHTDGLSLMLGVEELRALYVAESAGIDDQLPAPGSYVEYSGEERAAAGNLDLTAAPVQQWISILAANAGQLPTFPLDLGVARGEQTRSTRTHIDVLDTDESAAFAALCKANGVGFSTGIFAALALTEIEVANRTNYFALNAVGTRSDPRYRYSQGWFINLVPVSFTLSGVTSFTDALPLAHAARAAVKGLADVSIHSVIAEVSKLTGSDIGGTSVPPMVSYIDMRLIPGAEHHDELEARALGGPGTTGDLSMWINRKEDRTYVMVSFPDTEHAHTSVDRYLRHLRNVLRTVADAGDYRVVRQADARQEVETA